MTFNIGDRVIALQSVGDDGVTGVTGTVKEITEDTYGVEFDNYIDGHDLNNCCKYGHGWYCVEDEIGRLGHIPDVDQSLLSLSDAYDALRDGKRVRKTEDKHEVGVNEYNQLRWCQDSGGQEVPITMNTLRPGYFEIFDEFESVEITKYNSSSHSLMLEANGDNLICIDTIQEIKDSINKDDSIIRLYKNEGFNFRIEEDGERYEVFLTHSDGGQK